jgi:cellulose synthase (UDP-forming)
MIVDTVPRAGPVRLLLRGMLWLVAVCLFLLVCLTPLEAREQAMFAIGTCTVLILLSQIRGRFVTLLLVFLSLMVSTRYMIWRASDTLPYSSSVDLILGIGLLLAEFYNLIGLCLGYLQTAWPLDRRPMPLPADRALWPTVDIYIPTYGESLSVVRHTVLAASCLDWPADKLAVYLLDDGRREEFKEFAAAAGVGYLTRLDNKGAKAGNLNNAMRHTTGTFITIFDCDHIPTRAFLQLTMGWFLKDPHLSTVQTPHHFYSPDPFDRNLHLSHLVPTEGNLFYGLIQDGKDLWNSAFFCGSCAVLRRSALDKIGGFSTESVTEDALTALRLSRAGFNSAYLRLPLAAGLATERLALHIGQRVRWARGMVQILRFDNPLTGPGLTLAQRLSYLAASLYFLFPLPRIVFLTAPLAYLLLGINLISTPVGVLTAYLVPHFIHSLVTSSRVNQQHRHAFWDEVYETVLAFHLIWPTLKTAISPKAIAFNVTAKGGDVGEGFVDTRILWPHMALAGLLILGMLAGIVRYGLAIESDVSGATTMNMIWCAFNLILVATSIAVGHETRQVRHDVRIDTRLPVTMHLEDGHTRLADAVNISMGGALIQTLGTERYEVGQSIGMSLPAGQQTVHVKAKVVGRDATHLRLHFVIDGLDQERDLVQAVFGRADAWTEWESFPADNPLKSLVVMLRLASRAVRWPLRRKETLLPLLLLVALVAATPVVAQSPRLIPWCGRPPIRLPGWGCPTIWNSDPHWVKRACPLPSARMRSSPARHCVSPIPRPRTCCRGPAGWRCFGTANRFGRSTCWPGSRDRPP